MVTSIIPQRDREHLRDLFAEKLTADVRLTLFSEPTSRLFIPGREQCETCEDTGRLLAEVSDLSDRVELEVLQFRDEPARAREFGVGRIPAIVVEGAAKGRVRFFGIPAGYAFSVLVQDIVDVSRGTTELSPETKQALRDLTEDVHIQVFSTPT